MYYIEHFTCSAILLQSDAVQSGEAIMLFGQSIADEDARPGQIPRLLGECVFTFTSLLFLSAG